VVSKSVQRSFEAAERQDAAIVRKQAALADTSLHTGLRQLL